MNLKHSLVGVMGVFACAGALQAAAVTQVVEVHFDGSLAGTVYTLGAGELDTTGTFKGNGSPTVSGGTATNVTNGDGFDFDPTSLGSLVTQNWIAEIDFNPGADNAGQLLQATIIDVLGDLDFRYDTSGGTQAAYWDGSAVQNVSMADLPVGTSAHLALVWDAGTNTLSAYVDGALQGSTVSGTTFATPDTTNVSFGYFGRSGFDDRSVQGPYSAVAFSTFTGTFDPNTDFVIPEPASLALLGLGGLMMIRRRRA